MAFIILGCWFFGEQIAIIMRSAANYSMQFMGTFWQVFLLVHLLISLIIAFLPIGSIKIGNSDRPEHSTMQWVSMVLCTMMAAGIMFEGFYEPNYFFENGSHFFTAASDASDRSINALSQTFLNHNSSLWSIYAALSAFYVVYLNRTKGLPIAPRSMFYPVIGRAGVNGRLGVYIDTLCIFAILAGTSLSMSYAVVTVSSGLSAYFTSISQGALGFIFLIVTIAIYTLSALSGVKKGIRVLSSLNIRLSLLFLLTAFLFGPTKMILKSFILGEINELSSMISYTFFKDGESVFGTTAWMNKWRYFNIAFYISFLPTSSIFIIKVSKGRSIRSVILLMSIFSPLLAHLWFSMCAVSITNYLSIHDVSIPALDLASMIKITTVNFPFRDFYYCLYFALTTIFLITTADSISYVISDMVSEKHKKRNTVIVSFMLGLMTLALYSVGTSDSIDIFRNIVILSAIPVTVFVFPSSIMCAWRLMSIQWQQVRPIIFRHKAKDLGVNAKIL